MEKLKIVAKEEPNALVLQWSGEVTARDPGAVISPYLDAMLDDAGGKKIVLDFKSIDFMNSSTLLPIIAFLKKIDQAHLTAELRYNREVSWQRVSHQCMVVLCAKMTTVQVTYGPGQLLPGKR